MHYLSTDKVEELVTKPTAYDKLLNCIKERASYGDKQYPEVARRLGRVGSVELKAVGANGTQSSTNTQYMQTSVRELKRYMNSKYLQMSRFLLHRPLSNSSTLPSLARNQQHIGKTFVFFCDNGATYKDLLHQIATENAGRGLEKDIKQSVNEKLAVKLNTAIDPEDAHAIGIKYLKRFWRLNVFQSYRRKKKQEGVIGE